MTSPTHDHTHTRHADSPTRRPGPRSPPASWPRWRNWTTPRSRWVHSPAPPDGWATRSATLALISARTAGWWRVLLSADRRSRTTHPLYRRAVSAAHRKAQADARFWRETAADWQARVERRPTSDAAGALSNWAELGVTP